MADAPDSSPPCHADLRHLQERIQEIGEVAMIVNEMMRTECGNLHSEIVKTLQVFERNLGLMSRKKLIKVVAEFTTALNIVEEDLRHWAKYNRPMTFFKAKHIGHSIDHHRCHFQKLPNALNATPLLAPDANIFDDPTDPGAQIVTLRLSPDLEILPPTEMDAEVEKSPHYPVPMFACGDFDIWKMVWANRCYVAAKTYRGQLPWGMQEIPIARLKMNVDVWRSMKHPNILPLLGICTFVNDADPRVYFISPWMKNRSVRLYLSSNPGADRVQLIHDVALGLQYLHGIGVVHRNLRASNVLVNLDGTAVISGFSWSKILGPDNKRSEYCSISGHAWRWAPPSGELYWGKEEDIWSWSMTAIEILSGEWPFKNVENWSLANSIDVWHEGLRPSPEDYLPQHIASSGVWDLLNKCWKYKPEERINIDEVVADLEAERRANGWDPGAPSLSPRLDWDSPMSF